MPFYGVIHPERWVFATFMALASLSGGATKFICNFIRQNRILKKKRISSILKIFTVVIIILAINIDVSSFVRTYYQVPTIKLEQFPDVIKEFSNEDKYYRIYADLMRSIVPYVPAVSNRETLTGYYQEGTVLRDWLYGLDWAIGYSDSLDLIPAFFKITSVKYYIINATDSNKIKEFNKTGEFDISYVGDWSVIRLKQNTQYISAKKAILYVGKKEEFMTIAASMLLSSNSSVLIRGWKEYLDDYTIKELSRFDALLLCRYDYRRQSEMEQLLLQYTERGGVIILAPSYPHPILGMQLYTAESQGEHEIKANENFRDIVFRDVNLSRFSPAVYAGLYPWRYVAFNVTSSQREAETLLTIDGNPVLAVSTIGKGKILWIGFNFLAHINQFLNKDEERMIGNLIEWACGKPSRTYISSFEKRPYGYIDATVNIDGDEPFWLLISETYYPGWKVYVNQEPVEIYTSEPKLMVIRVETTFNNNLSISMRYEPTEIHILGFAVSILSVFLTAVMMAWKSFKKQTYRSNKLHNNFNARRNRDESAGALKF